MQPSETTWIWLTLMAVVAQTFRTAGQKHLAERLDTVTVTFIRYLYGLPFVGLALFVFAYSSAFEMPAGNLVFWSFVAVAGFAQIAATILMIRLFALRNFAVGITYVRSETLLTALIGVTLFAEAIGGMGWLAIVVSSVGIVVMNISHMDRGDIGWRDWIFNRSMLLGVGSGVLFAVTSLAIRTASLSLSEGDYMVKGLFTLICTITLQILVMAPYFVWRGRGFVLTMIREWRLSLFIGLTSAIGSTGWFTAFTIQKAAYVKALGQVELLFALIVARGFFKERPSVLDLAGVALVASGILILVLK